MLYRGNLASDIRINLAVMPDHWKPIGEHLGVNHTGRTCNKFDRQRHATRHAASNICEHITPASVRENRMIFHSRILFFS